MLKQERNEDDRKWPMGLEVGAVYFDVQIPAFNSFIFFSDWNSRAFLGNLPVVTIMTNADSDYRIWTNGLCSHHHGVNGLATMSFYTFLLHVPVLRGHRLSPDRNLAKRCETFSGWSAFLPPEIHSFPLPSLSVLFLPSATRAIELQYLRDDRIMVP